MRIVVLLTLLSMPVLGQDFQDSVIRPESSGGCIHFGLQNPMQSYMPSRAEILEFYSESNPADLCSLYDYAAVNGEMASLPFGDFRAKYDLRVEWVPGFLLRHRVDQDISVYNSVGSTYIVYSGLPYITNYFIFKYEKPEYGPKFVQVIHYGRGRVYDR